MHIKIPLEVIFTRLQCLPQQVVLVTAISRECLSLQVRCHTYCT